MRDARQCETHLNATERTQERESIHIPQVPNPEDFSFQFAETGAERHVEVLQNGRPQLFRIRSLRHDDGGEGDVPPSMVPLPMLDLELSVVPEVGAF